MNGIRTLSVTVSLTNFVTNYTQKDLQYTDVRLGSSKVIIDQGVIIKKENSKEGITILTKNWHDWVDYRAIDYDHKSKKEMIADIGLVEKPAVWTGKYIFKNEW